MAAPTTTEQVVNIARQFWPALGPAIDVAAAQLESYRTLAQALVKLQQAEQNVVTAGATLEELSAFGLATAHDFTAYGVLRANVFNTEMSLFRLIRDGVARVDPTKAKQLPTPRLLPIPARPAQMLTLREPYPLPAYMPMASGRGALQAAAAGAAASAAASESEELTERARTAAPILWAAAVVAALVALAVMVVAGAWVMTTAAEELARIFVLHEQTEQYKALLERRLEAYRACMARESSTDEGCRAEVGLLVPTPEEAGFEAPTTDDNIYKAVVWTVGAVALGAGAWIFFGSDLAAKLKRSASLQGAKTKTTTPPKAKSKPKPKPKRRKRRKQISGPKEVADLDGPSTYDLEVEG